MKLRTRLLISILCALIAGMTIAAVITVLQARRSVAVEVGTALAVGRQSLASELQTLPASSDPEGVLQRIVASFDGDRHLRALLVAADGRPLALSSVAPLLDQVPDWFTRAIGSRVETAALRVPIEAGGAARIELQTDPRSEVAEVWRTFKGTLLVAALMGLVSALLVWLAIAQALKPLAEFSSALRSVGAGRLDARLALDGPPDLVPIANAFNEMCEDLTLVRERNLELHRQLLGAQEAERAEIARDLHDEIGSLLFAINVETSAIERDAGASVEAAKSIRDAVQELRTRIRSIVNRLRPVGLAELGLGHAIDSLAAFWRRLHPHVTFHVDHAAGEDTIDDVTALTAYRIVQEAVSNALRHGHPDQVDITIAATGEPVSELVVTVSDDGAGNADIEPGLGLLGMRERVAASGGRFTVSTIPGHGFSVTATLPTEGQLATAAVA